MAISTALREARERLGLTQEAIGAMGCVTNKLISEVERGNRRLAKDVGRRIAQQLDDARFHLAWAAEAAGGVFVAGPLDGVDTHPAAVVLRGQEEIEELLEAKLALRRQLGRAHGKLTDEDRRAVQQVVQEAIDVITWGQVFVAAVCEHFGLSLAEQYELHRRKLQERGYQTKAGAPASTRSGAR
ncbi:MAG: hypothetical protein BAA04_09745 [Firmicutes bacterium ZCTH02-B6]|nr:MAG: hypothetical protein BAA04_09745 [Firmicutes bacterium ZCTH02-B6]